MMLGKAISCWISASNDMLAIKWFLRTVWDAILVGVVNRSPWQSILIVFFLFVGLIIVASQVSAPFIYTLF